MKKLFSLFKGKGESVSKAGERVPSRDTETRQGASVEDRSQEEDVTGCADPHSELQPVGPTMTQRKSSDLNAPKLKEQLSSKMRNQSAIPGSFYDRDIAFKSNAYEERRAAVPPRHQGSCQIKQGRFGSWSDVWCKVSSGSMKVFKAATNMDLLQDIPDESQLGERWLKIVLVGSHLSASKTCDREFQLVETDGSVVHLRCLSARARDEWLVGLSQVPGLFKRVEDYYKIGNLWGSGATCKVQECYSKFTGKKYALKSRIQSNRKSTEAMHNELRILQMCAKKPHPAVPKLIDFFFDTSGEIELVTELMEGGELFEDIIRSSGFTEEKAKFLFQQIASGVAHLHSLGIAHRDLKPENIMYAQEISSVASLNDLQIKIMDYDLAKVNYSPEWSASTPCGTVKYMAPEMLHGQSYSLAIDNWSLGVCLYVMLSGCFPFGGSTEEEVKEAISEEQLCLEGTFWESVSSQAKDLIRQFLVLDPQDRLTASGCLNHPWLQSMQQRKKSENIVIAGKSLETMPFIDESPQYSLTLSDSNFLQVEDHDRKSSANRDDEDLSRLKVVLDLVGHHAGVPDSREERSKAGPGSPVRAKRSDEKPAHKPGDSFADLDSEMVSSYIDEHVGDI